MKKIFLFSTIAASMALVSCDNIAPDDRYIEVEVNKSEKVVLLEDYTGMQCVNCPEAASIIDNIHHTYGDQFIAVGLHPSSGPYQKPMPIAQGSKELLDLSSADADAYYKKYSVKAFPTAMIDRSSFDGSKLLDNKDKWAAYVNQQMTVSNPVDISITSTYNAATRTVKLATDIKFKEAVTEELYLQLWVIENGIIGPQVTAKGINWEYEHNHVLRSAVNGTWGQSIGASFAANKHLETITTTYTLNEEWNADNCEIVGFVYRASDDVILQAHLVDIVADKRPEKVVLLEDYTGMQCVNCPEAASIIDNIHHTFGNRFIAVGLHPASGPYQKPMPIAQGSKELLDLSSTDADAYYKKYSVKAFPTAMIDRSTFDGSKLLDNKDKWSSYVFKKMEETTPINISMASTYDAATRTVTLATDIAFFETVGEELYLQLWVIENGIIGPQVTAKGINWEYEHNHVLRSAINGTWGESIGASFAANQRLETITTTYTLNEAWNADNCEIVGFVYRASDDVILQAHLVDIIASEETPSEE